MNENLLETDIPEKFKDPETGGLQSEKLLKSYMELERKMSEGPSAPKTPDEYQLDVSHGMFDIDPEVNARLHQCGFTNDQAQEVYNLAAEKLAPMIAEMMSDFEADREVEKLINHFGGPEKWQEISRQMLSYGQKNLKPEVLDNLSSSYEGVLALHRLMQSEEPSLKLREGNAGSSSEEKDLQSMMRDPKYWRDRDPAVIDKVTKGFQKIYGQN